MMYFDDLEIVQTVHKLIGKYTSAAINPPVLSMCFLRQGGITIEMDGKEYPAPAPYFFWALPGHIYRFCSLKREKRETFWLDMKGPRADRIAGALALLEQPGLPVRDSVQMFLLMTGIMESVKVKDRNQQHRIVLQIEMLISRLYEEISHRQSPGAFAGSIQEAEEKFRLHPELRYDIHKISQECGMSYDNFRKIFKKRTGLAPGAYILKAKMDYASRLLHSAITVKEAADACGFGDVSSFSRMFRKKTGLYPREYRRRLQSGLG